MAIHEKNSELMRVIFLPVQSSARRERRVVGQQISRRVEANEDIAALFLKGTTKMIFAHIRLSCLAP